MRSSKLLDNFLLFAKIFFLWVTLLLPKLASAQTDKEFWFVAPSVFDAGRGFGKPISLRMTTSATPASIVISMPANLAFAPVTIDIPANSTESIDLTYAIDQIENTPPNTVLGKGLLISSSADITAYYEVVSAYCDCNPEIFSLKGKNALGTEFYISSQSSYDESTNYGGTNGFDIVATKNNTHVTITPKQNIVGHAANVPFTITLNTGQTYSAIAVSGSASGHLQGSHVTSDNPVAITLKDDLVQVSSCADLIGDQTVPVNVLGNEYIVTQGFLQPYDNVYIMAITDGTSVYVDGNSSPITVLSKGQSYTLNLTGASTYIRSDKNIYVYHFTGNGCEAGSAIIPKINCTGSRRVNVVRSSPDLFAVLITTKNGNQGSFSVNGNSTLIGSTDFSPVPGTGGAYVTAKIDLSGSAAVGSALSFSNSIGNFSLGFINGGSSSGARYGFFSDFKSSNVDKSDLETCAATPVQLNAYGGATYSWSPAVGLSNPNIANPTASPTATTDYTVTITTAEGCVDYATVHIKVSSGAVIPSVSIVASANNICPGTLVNFTATPINGGATPVYQWMVNGINAGTNSPTFGSSTLVNGDKVTVKMTSNAPCASPASVTSNSITMNVIATTPSSVSIAASQNNVCEGTLVTFVATPVNGGINPVYQWQVNGINVGANDTSPTFASSTLANGDKVSCVMTSTSAACSLPFTSPSNVVTMVVNPTLQAEVSIAVSQNSVCEGTLVTFTATPINGGTAPIYQWYINGVNAGSNSPTFASSTLANTDRVTCTMTSNALCALPTVATSNLIQMDISLPVTPFISIAQTSTNTCAGESVEFIATYSAGGATPTFQWTVNGVNAGTTPFFASTTLVNGDVVKCILTSNAACATTPTATSNAIVVSLTAAVTPSVTIAASTNNICKGTAVTFTATAQNGGAGPVYQWLINGNPVGTNNNTFVSSTLNNNDIVSCSLTSNAPCAVPATVVSNNVTMVVNDPLVVLISIAASQNNVCEGTTVNFTATPVNGGSTPTYQWQVNGTNVGINSPAFSSGTLVNGDKVTCTITSSLPCVVQATVTSNVITMSINPYVTPSVTIVSSTNNICPGEAMLFTATPVNGGTSPSYQWLLNGIPTGNNSASFSSNALVNGDLVTCVLTSSAPCTTLPTAGSNTIIVNVTPPVTPTVTVGVSENSVCAGTAVTFTATPVNGGTAPIYQWLINGNPTGGNDNTLVRSNLNNNDVVSCRLTSNLRCAIANILSNNVIMIINPLPVVNGGGDKTVERGSSVQISATATGGIADITWSPSASLNNNKILAPRATPDNTITYTVTVRSTDGCTNSATVKVTVLISVTPPNTFTPNNDGINDKWEIKNLADYPNADLKIFTRWGVQVYRSSGNVNAWDGTFNGKPLPTGTYYYIITLGKGKQPISGSVALLR